MRIASPITLLTSFLAASSVYNHSPTTVTAAYLTPFKSAPGQSLALTQRGISADICVDLHANLLLEFPLLVGILRVLGVKIDGIFGKLDLCVCLSTVAGLVEARPDLQIIAKVYSKTRLRTTIEHLITSSSQQCGCPKNANPVCSVGGGCGFECKPNYHKDPHGVCVCSQCSPVPQHPKRRRFGRSRGPFCPEPHTACGVYSGRSNAWECVDTRFDLESCGGCVIPLLGDSTLPLGQDCTEIQNVHTVACINGRCKVERCNRGFAPSSDSTACIRTSTPTGPDVSAVYDKLFLKDHADVQPTNFHSTPSIDTHPSPLHDAAVVSSATLFQLLPGSDIDVVRRALASIIDTYGKVERRSELVASSGYGVEDLRIWDSILDGMSKGFIAFSSTSDSESAQRSMIANPPDGSTKGVLLYLQALIQIIIEQRNRITSDAESAIVNASSLLVYLDNVGMLALHQEIADYAEGRIKQPSQTLQEVLNCRLFTASELIVLGQIIEAARSAMDAGGDPRVFIPRTSEIASLSLADLRFLEVFIHSLLV